MGSGNSEMCFGRCIAPRAGLPSQWPRPITARAAGLRMGTSFGGASHQQNPSQKGSHQCEGCEPADSSHEGKRGCLREKLGEVAAKMKWLGTFFQQAASNISLFHNFIHRHEHGSLTAQ